MAQGANVYLRSGEKIEWEDGNLVCIKKANGKFRLVVKDRRSTVKNKDNKWIFKEEFEYLSKPQRYISIVRSLGNSRLINLLTGIYITKTTLYVKKRLNDNCYLVKDLADNKEFVYTSSFRW